MNLDEYNISQQKAVSFEGKHLLVLAGAGTGKTKTIIGRAAYLISKGVNPSKIQILTFTKRAANEIVSRVNSTLNSSEANTLNGSTFHSWCNQLITKYPNLFGTNSFTIIDEDDQRSIMKIVCGKNSLQFENLRIKAQELIDLYSFARNTKNNLTNTIRLKLFNNSMDEETNKKIEKIRPQVETLLKGYEQKKKERKYLDYDDLLLVVAIRVAKDEQAKKIISAQYEHLLVDEMQDTNPLQWDLINPFQDICHLFCVGDDAQSIYSFRGADFRNIHSFKERVKDAVVYKLEDNYRSTQEILDLSNWLLGNSTITYDKKLHAIRGSGIIPKIVNTEDEWDEANWIVENIINNYTSRNKTYSDHLVLSRSGYYTRTLQSILIQKKIPYVTFGGRKFMESAHIKDLVSALRIVNNHYDEIAWVRFLMLWDGIGEIKASNYIKELLKKKSIQECISWIKNDTIEKERNTISQVLQSVFDNRFNVQEAVKTSFNALESNLSRIYKQDWDNKRKPDFPVLIILGSNYTTLGEFITECVLDNSANINNSPNLATTSLSRTESKDHIIISTIHSAKGLEADICYVLNVSPKNFPSAMSLDNEDEIEEERRVLYVALTRAKNELILTRNTSSIYAEQKLSLKVSFTDKLTVETSHNDQYFLNSLPANLVEQCVINKQSFEVKDIEQSNDLDLSSNFDFS